MKVNVQYNVYRDATASEEVGSGVMLHSILKIGRYAYCNIV